MVSRLNPFLRLLTQQPAETMLLKGQGNRTHLSLKASRHPSSHSEKKPKSSFAHTKLHDLPSCLFLLLFSPLPTAPPASPLPLFESMSLVLPQGLCTCCSEHP